MSEPYFPEKIKFFCGLIFREDLLSLNDIYILLKDVLELDEHSLFHEEKNCSLNAYYETEMGPREKLRRVWIFSNSIDERILLLEKKKRTNSIEIEVSNSLSLKGRAINIDPGYLGLEQIVLATNKPYSHRLYYGEGIYGDLTYQYLNKSWCTLPWTYPDYTLENVLKFFELARDALKNDLKS
ncbi:MAG: DUF4416 family protein [Bacteriovoracaceae bacterium]|nr:DUF4416 family protein [Bacteriovoracaceae bacterium]